MVYDWKALAPHKPVDPGGDAYVPPPSGGAREIADWVLAGAAAVLVGGPVGVGKSTELAQTAKLLQADRVACLVPLDRWENMRRLTADRLLLRLAGRLAHVASRVLSLRLSRELREFLVAAGVLVDEPGGGDAPSVVPLAGGFSASARATLLYAIREVTRLAAQRRVSFLVDGLEKVAPGPGSVELFDTLSSLPDEVDLVVVIPWHASFGPRTDAIIRPGERFVSLRALEVEGDIGDRGRRWLTDIVAKRLGIEPAELDPSPIVASSLFEDDESARAHVSVRRDIVTDAARWSGGVPRTFLQLLADAGTYARLRRAANWPEAADLIGAVADQQDSFRRLLLPGDTEAIHAAVGTDGREMELTRKVRLMAHGVLLERIRDRRPVLELHPLAHAVMDEVRRNA
jgi:hypothetical protein